MERTLKKGFKTAECKLVIGVTADRETEQENPRYQCGDCNGILAADVFDVDRVGGYE